VAYSAENLSALPLRAAMSVPIAVVAMVVIEPGALPRDAMQIGIVLVSMLGAWLINFLTMALIGTLAFFLESSTAIFELWLVAFMLLSGYLVPLSLFPPWAGRIAAALPFRYAVAFPVEATVGILRGDAALHDLWVQWAWVAGCGAAALLAWRAGLRRFAAFGG
jgi:ABC-2 type transport system permease protein